MPKILKNSTTYDVLFKEDMVFYPYKNKSISHTFKKDAPFMKSIDKEKLVFFYNMPIYEMTRLGFGLGGKILLNPREDFYFVEVNEVISQVIKTTPINPENL